MGVLTRLADLLPGRKAQEEPAQSLVAVAPPPAIEPVKDEPVVATPVQAHPVKPFILGISDAPKRSGVQGFRRVRNKGQEYGGSPPPNLHFNKTEYDLTEVASALDTESLFRRAVDKYVEHIWKDSFGIVGQDDKAVRYIRKRLSEIAQVTGVPTWQLFENIAQQLVPYYNCFVVKVRSDRSSTGRIRRTFDGRRLQPVAGYFVLDATSIEIARDEHGTVKMYKQFIPGNTEPAAKFRPDDMIHIFLSRKVGLAAGTPMVTPVLDDIRALRRMEENVELLVFQHAIPLFQLKVGTEEIPADASEIANARFNIQEMPSHGMLVTPERYEINAVGAEGQAIRAEPYIEYFKARVVAGLGMSGVAFGEGDTSNRNTADTMDEGIKDTARKFQQVIKQFVDEFIIKELLAEGGFVDAPEDGNKLVELYISEIELDKQLKLANHYQLLFESDLVGRDFARRQMGLDDMEEEERKDTHWELIGKPKAIIAAVDETSPFSKSDVNKGTENRVRPANQQGKKPAATKAINSGLVWTNVTPTIQGDYISTSDVQMLPEDAQITAKSKSLLEIIGVDDLKTILNQRYDDVRMDVVNKVVSSKSLKSSDLTITLGAIHTSFTVQLNGFLKQAYGRGLADMQSDMLDIAERKVDVSGPFASGLLEDRAKRDITRFIGDLEKRLKNKLDDPLQVGAIFDSMRYRNDFIARTAMMYGYNLGYTFAARLAGYTKLDVVSQSNDSRHAQCAAHGVTVDIETLNQEVLPPYHPNCLCRVKVK